MPPHNKVPPLNAIAREKVLFDVCAIILQEIFITSIEDWEVSAVPYMTPRLLSVKEILIDSIGPKEMQDILNITLSRDDVVEPSVRYLAIQLLLANGANMLVVGHFPESYYSSVLEAIAESAANLERLDLKGLWVREEDKYCLCKALRRLQNIKHLILRYVCDDEVLGIIGKHCRKIEKLDISGSNNITDAGILSLMSCPARCWDGDKLSSLQIVDLGGPGAQMLPISIVSKLLVGLPNLISLGSFDRTGLAIKSVYDEEPNFQLKLKYIHDLRTKSDVMSVISKVCPNIQAIYLDTPGAVAVQHLDMLKQLTELKVNRVKWTNIVALLQKCGSRLRHVFLLSVWEQLDFLTLGILCPSLVRLELHSVSLSCSDIHHEYAFKMVKNMKIYNSQISTTCVKFILNQSIDMEHLSLGECGQITDAAIMSSLMDHSLQKVDSLWFGLAESLTLRTIQALMEHCPELNSLGNLAAWSVSQEDILLLKEQLHLLNIDLHLHDYGPEEEEGDLFMIVPP